MATPEAKVEPPTETTQPTGGAKPGKNGKAAKAAKAAKAPKARKTGEKTARQHAIDILMKASGHQLKFGELVNEVSKRMGGKLTWTPTYYLKSPGFSSPERGVYKYDPKAEENGRAEIKAERTARLAKARESAGKNPKAAKAAKAAKATKAKKAKAETTEQRRQRTAAELKANNEKVKAEFDAAAAEQANGNKKETA